MGFGLVLDCNSGLDSNKAASRRMADRVERRRRCCSRFLWARASEFSIYLLGVIIWGLLGGIAWSTQPGIARADVRTLGKTIAGGLFVGFFGSLLAALIGNLLLRVDPKGGRLRDWICFDGSMLDRGDRQRDYARQFASRSR